MRRQLAGDLEGQVRQVRREPGVELAEGAGEGQEWRDGLGRLGRQQRRVHRVAR